MPEMRVQIPPTRSPDFSSFFCTSFTRHFRRTHRHACAGSFNTTNTRFGRCTMTIFGQHEEKTLIQFEHIRAHAVHAALMADGHVGYVMPIGGVAAYRNQISVVGVGFDIACGNAAIRTNLTLASLGDDTPSIQAALTTLADEIAAMVSFGIGRKNRADDAPVQHPLFDDAAWEAVPPTHRSALHDKARAQLGTVGSGNHYVVDRWATTR